ncbi:FliH/SctL family protein [Burkholderia semiarida]|uniref:Flagellar assembly protein FliH n=1 Tax=Burkholderia semiarida TaxID=2843303 RepID=A0ABW7L8T6_9BURK
MHAYRKFSFPSISAAHAKQTGAAENSMVPQSCESEVLEIDPDEARQTDYEAGYEAGYGAGRQAGERDGLDAVRGEAREALDALVAPLDALAEGLRASRLDDRSGMRGEVALLAEKVARQVIRAELETRPERVLEFVDEALALMPRQPDTVEVRINEDDYRRIEAVAPERLRSWSVVPDARLEPGECRVKAGEREFDAGCGQRLAGCFERIAAHLGGPLDAPHDEGGNER